MKFLSLHLSRLLSEEHFQFMKLFSQLLDRHLLICLALLLALPIFVSAQNYSQAKRDSLLEVIPTLEGREKLQAQMELGYLYAYKCDNKQILDTLLAIYKEVIEEAKKQNDVVMEGLAKANEIPALGNSYMCEEVIKRAPAYLDFFAEHQQWYCYII